MKRIRHFIEYLLAFVLVLALIFTIVGVVIVKFYGEELKQFAVESINEQVDTKVNVEEVGISLFREFPFTSVFFKDVIIWSGHGFDRTSFGGDRVDTLFVAEYISLQFNPFDLLRKKYTVRRFSAEQGELFLLTDNQGGANFRLKDRGKQESNGNTLVELREVNLKNISVELVNLAKDQQGRISIHNAAVSGNFSSSSFQLDVRGNSTLEGWSESGVDYFTGQDISADISFRVADSLYTIDRGMLDLGYIVADLNGNAVYAPGRGADLDLELHARKIDIPWLLDLAIRRGSAGLESIKIRGNADLTANISGWASPTRSPDISAGFSLSGTHVSADFLPFAIRSVALRGTFSNGKKRNLETTSIDLEELRFSFLNSSLDATFGISNLTSPVYRVGATGEIEVSDLNEILPDFPVKFTGGILVPDISLSGRISGMQGSERSFTFFPGGQITANAIEIQPKGKGPGISDLNGSLELGYQQWNSSWTGRHSGSPFSVTLSHNNPVNHLTGDGYLNIHTDIRSAGLDLDQLLSITGERKRDTASVKWPRRINVSAEAVIDRLIIRDTPFSDVSLEGGYIYPDIFIERFSAGAWSGRLNASAVYGLSDAGTGRLNLESEIENVDIQGLFNTFDNFGQEQITAEQIMGNLSAETELHAEFNNENKINTRSIVAESDIRVTHGELLDFEPLIRMSRLLKIKKMDRVAFSTLENSIVIGNNTLTIPEMDINANDLNLSASGSQGFDGTYTYHLSVRLSEILFQKARNTADREFEVALDRDDSRTVFLVLYDDGRGMNIEFDEEQAMKKLRQDLRDEKQELKRILKDEFGAFRKDTTVGDTRSDEQPVLRFEFPDEQDSQKKPEEKKRKRWWQKSEDKKQELNFVIENNDNG